MTLLWWQSLRGRGVGGVGGLVGGWGGGRGGRGVGADVRLLGP